MLNIDGCIRMLNTLKIKEMKNWDSEYLSLIINSLKPSRQLYRILQFVTNVPRVNLWMESL